MIRLLGTIVFSMSLGMSAFGQVQYEHVLTIENPRGEDSRGDRFGESVAVVGDTIAVGARNDDTGAENTGAAYLFDRNGSLLTSFFNPSPDPDDWFGEIVTAVGDDRVLIGSRRDDDGADNAGVAYLFDLQGNLLQEFVNPEPVANGEFGKWTTSNGELVAITAWGNVIENEIEGAAYLFDLDGDLLRRYASPKAAQTGSDFGRSITFAGADLILISDHLDDTGFNNAGAAFLFDLDGNLLAEYLNPTPGPQSTEGFGTQVLSVGDKVVIGAAQEGSVIEESGAAYVFDIEGNLLTTIPDPEPNVTNWFGWSGAAVDDERFIISSIFNDDLGINSGKAFLYDLKGDLLHTFTSPEPHMGQHFGHSIDVLDQDILISEEAAGAGATGFGSVFMFQPVSIDGDSDLDGDVDLNDFNVFKSNFGTGDRFRHGDFDRDLEVDLADFNILKNNLGNSQPVPEPTTLLLLAIGFVSMMLFTQWRWPL